MRASRILISFLDDIIVDDAAGRWILGLKDPTRAWSPHQYSI
jgi:hypothetical protein